MSTEAAELRGYLVGDRLVRPGHSHAELLEKGPATLTIDGHEVSISRVQLGFDAVNQTSTTRLTTIYDAAIKLYGQTLGEENPIPILCHREHMTPVAVCRVCAVEVAGAPRLVPACQRPVEDKLVVSTLKTSPKVHSAVRVLTELLVTDNRKARVGTREFGENELVTLANRMGVRESRFPKAECIRGEDESSLVIAVDHDACILCDRCVRACNEVRHNEVIGRMGKGFTTRIAFDLNDPMGRSSCVACGECMISCPTGALTHKAVVAPADDHVPGDEVTLEEITAIPLFQGISKPFLEWNKHAIRRRRLKPGEIVCEEGTYGSTAFLIEKGKFEIRIRSQLGHVHKRASGGHGLFGKILPFLTNREQHHRAGESQKPFISVDAPVGLDYDSPVAELTEADMLFGEMACMNNYPRSATVMAKEDSSVLEIQRNVLYMLQRNRLSRMALNQLYRHRTLDTHLRSVRTFREALSDAEFAQVADFLRSRVQLIRSTPGEVIFRQGDPADHFYLVRVGFVKVSQNRMGGEHVLTYIGPGGYFGEIGLLSQLPELRAQVPKPAVRTATCSALDHVDLVRVAGDDFRTLVSTYPALGKKLVAVALDCLEDNQTESMQIEHVPLAEFLDQGLFQAQSLLVLDLEKCTRCDECTRACADAHFGVTRLIREGLRFDKFLVASSCRSCLDPYCLVGCPVDAIHRRGSREIIIEDSCIGCGKCAQNCPYGNINMEGFFQGEYTQDAGTSRSIPVLRQKATTCDLCSGLPDRQPSCVYACPHDAAHRMSGSDLLEIVKGKG